MSEKHYLPRYTGCLVCGDPQHNPITLQRRFELIEDGVQVEFTADDRYIGYPGMVHGGIICALLDETIGWAVAVRRRQLFVTCELSVRFIRPLPVGLSVKVTGRAVEDKSRYSIGEGEIKDESGTVYAKGSGKFFLMKDEDSKRMNSVLTVSAEDLHILDEL